METNSILSKGVDIMLRNELKEIQKKRAFCYKMLQQFSNKMSYKQMITYIDYLNINQLLNEIDGLNEKGSKIVYEIHKNNVEKMCCYE